MPGTSLTIYPTLVIGLGGTGTNVVRYAKRRFLRMWNTARQRDPNAPNIEDAVDLPGVLQVLAVDTEPLVNETGEEPLYFHEFAFMGKFDATRLVQNRANHSPYLDWWGWNEHDIPLGYIHNGAKQLRPIGRLAFFRNYVTFKNLVTDKLQAMGEERAIQEAQELHFDVAGGYRLVYIVSSLCGGTGAGMFLDAAHVVRHYVGSSASIVGIFMMPSVFEKEVRSDLQRRRIQANAYAALKELNAFHTSPNFSVEYPSEQGPIPTTPYRAFNQIFLVERTSTEGRTLTSKTAAEQMAAHLIHLTAFSHLNKRILGFDVNVTEERTAALGGGSRNFMAYSSFGVSSLVMPREALWRYFTARVKEQATQWLYETSYDETIFRGQYRALLGRIQDHFRGYFPLLKNVDQIGVDEQLLLANLNALAEGIAQRNGRWLEFEQILDAGMREVFAQHGFMALWELLHRMQRRQDDPGASPDDLASENQMPRPIVQVPPPPRGLQRLVERFASAQAQIQARRAARQREVADRSAAVWRALVERIQHYAREMLNRFDAVYGEQSAVYQQFAERVQQSAHYIHPLTRNGDIETSTYYDLETGAVGIEHLNEFWNTTSALLLQGQSEADPSTPWGTLIAALYDWLMRSQDSALVGIDLTVRTTLDYLPHVRAQIDQAFDIRNIVYVQHNRADRAPNHRINQAMDRVHPHATIDADTHYYSEANQEHTRLVSKPITGSKNGTARAGGDERNGRALDSALRGYTQFIPIEAGDPNRIDACHLVHGLPVAYLNTVPELFRQYMGKEFEPRLLHLRPEWAALKELDGSESKVVGGVSATSSAAPDRSAVTPGGGDPAGNGPSTMGAGDTAPASSASSTPVRGSAPSATSAASAPSEVSSGRPPRSSSPI